MQLQGRASGKPRLPMPETDQQQKEIIKKALLSASLI
jgi:dihydrodipicolinate synthase/N-acetylneuraminate lyase